MAKKISVTGTIATGIGKTWASYQKSKTPTARLKKAKEQLASLEAKEKAELFEKKFKENMAEYRKTHPTRIDFILKSIRK